MEIRGMKTISFIYDDVDVPVALTQPVTQAGYRVVPYGDATAALCDLIDGVNVDLVITDCRRSEIDGLPLVSVLRQLAPNVPVVALGGDGRADRFLEGTNVAPFKYLNKPVSTEELLRVVNASLNHSSFLPIGANPQLSVQVKVIH